MRKEPATLNTPTTKMVQVAGAQVSVMHPPALICMAQGSPQHSVQAAVPLLPEVDQPAVPPCAPSPVPPTPLTGLYQWVGRPAPAGPPRHLLPWLRPQTQRPPLHPGDLGNAWKCRGVRIVNKAVPEKRQNGVVIIRCGAEPSARGTIYSSCLPASFTCCCRIKLPAVRAWFL